jgi:hypothetical protein
MNEQGTKPAEAQATDLEPDSIMVVGDEAIDWFEIVVPPDEESAADLPSNFRVTGGLRRTWEVGGAALLRKMLCVAVRPKVCSERSIDDPHAIKLQTVVRLRKYVEHIDKQPDRAVYRAEQLIGFVVETDQGKGKKDESDTTSPPDAGDASSKARIVLVDDSGNGFRRSELSDELCQKIAGAELVLIRLSRPLAVRGDGPAAEANTCLDKILDSRSDRRTLVVLNVNDLRREGLDISRRLSWERTAGDLARARTAALRGSTEQRGFKLLADLLRRADIVVRVGVEGAVFLPMDRDEKPILAFDPASIEDNRREEGYMVGLRTCFVAALTAALARNSAADFHNRIERGLPESLRAAARLFHHGCDVEIPSAKDRKLPEKATAFRVTYPYAELFRKRGKNADGVPTFESVQVDEDEAWSLLVDGCRKIGSKRLDPIKIVTDGVDELKGIPSAIYGKLRLVDIHEIEAFRAIDNLFREYHQRHGRINARDARPLSIAVFGQPGSGKSFSIKEVAKSALRDAMAPSEINLSQLQRPDQLEQVFFSFRNDSLVGKMPVVLFDECDAYFQSSPVGWLKYFLMPMQDGQFSRDGRAHSIGPAIFVFIGGTKPTFKAFAEQGHEGEEKQESEGQRSKENDGEGEGRQDRRETFIQAKLPDFVSRLRGHVDIQGPNPNPSRDEDVAFQIRRAVILRNVLEREKVHCPRMFTGDRIHIDPMVVRAFLGCDEYRHGTRSLEAIVGMSHLAGRDRFDVAALPAEKQLRMHVDETFDDILLGKVRRK